MGEFVCHVSHHRCGGFSSLYMCVNNKKPGDLNCLNNPLITISLIINIVSNQRTNNFTGICGYSGVKGCLSIFLFDNINFASPDNHSLKIYFGFPLEPWYYRRIFDAAIYKTTNHPDTLLIL